MASKAESEARAADVNLVRRVFDAFSRGDTEAVLAMMDPKVEIHVPASIPNSGTYYGHSGIPVEMDAWYLNEVRGATFAALHMYPIREQAIEAAQRRERA